MTDVEELRDMLTHQAGNAPDAAGMLRDVHAGAARLRRRRRYLAGAGAVGGVGAAAAVMLVTVVGLGPSRPEGPAGGVDVNAATRAPDELTVEIAADPTYRVAELRVDPERTQLVLWPDYADGVQDPMVDPLARSATIEVLEPGRFDPVQLKADGEQVTVAGHPAWYIRPLAQGETPKNTPPPPSGQVSSPFEDAVGWAGPNGTWVLVSGGGRFPRAELLAVAGLVRTVPGREVTGPVRLPYLPAGVRPHAVNASADYGSNYDPTRFDRVYSLPGATAPTTAPTDPLDPAFAREVQRLRVTAYPGRDDLMSHAPEWGAPVRAGDKEIWKLTAEQVPESSTLSSFATGPLVVARTDRCVVTFSADGSAAVPVAELEKMAREAELGDCKSPATWGAPF